MSTTSLLLHLNGANGTSVFTDDSTYAHVIANGGTPTHTTANKKYGQSALDLAAASSEYISAPDNISLDISAGSFTFDCWIRPTDITDVMIWSQVTDVDNRNIFYIEGANKLRFFSRVAAATVIDITTTTAISASVWTHVALVRDGTTVSIYINGVLDVSVTLSGSIHYNANGIDIGYQNLGGSELYYSGQIDEVRLLKGYAAWTEDFVPPVSEYAYPTTTVAISFTPPTLVASGTHWTGSAAPVFPSFTMVSTGIVYTGSGAVTFSAFTLATEGRTVPSGADVKFPSFDVAATGLVDTNGSANISFSSFNVSSSGGERSAFIDFTPFSVSSSGKVHVKGSSNSIFRKFSISSSGIVPVHGSGAISFSAFRLNTTGFPDSAGRSSLLFSSFNLVSSGYTGIRSSGGSIIFPPFAVAATGLVDTKTSVSIIFESFTLLSNGRVIEASPTTVVAAINVNNAAVSEYTNFNFNSFCKFGDKYIGSDTSGIYLLSGLDDDGTNIPAVVETGITNIKGERFKRVPEAYISYRTNGGIYVKTITDEEVERVYQILHDNLSGKKGVHERRVKFNKGVKSGRWAFGISNESGSWFEITSMTIVYRELSRMSRNG